MNGFVDSEETIKNFLQETRELIESDSFDINRDFIMKEVRYNDDPLHPKNKETMLALAYDALDVLEEIKTLTSEHYYQALPDNNPGPSPFDLLVKIIHTRQVAIKYKIKQLRSKLIFCISFHFPEYEINLANLPYRRT